jgi:two-component system sensor histidine kinase PilS (NtrC family)
VQLSVWSQGPPLDEHVKTHLFEPFVTSGSRSSGLGLYICQELCQRYHATLHYMRQDDQGVMGNAFHITMPIFRTHAPC